MAKAFSGLKAITGLDISMLNTDEVTNMEICSWAVKQYLILI
jgi:surface protein